MSEAIPLIANIDAFKVAHHLGESECNLLLLSRQNPDALVLSRVVGGQVGEVFYSCCLVADSDERVGLGGLDRWVGS